MTKNYRKTENDFVIKRNQPKNESIFTLPGVLQNLKACAASGPHEV